MLTAYDSQVGFMEPTRLAYLATSSLTRQAAQRQALLPVPFTGFTAICRVPAGVIVHVCSYVEGMY